VWVTRTLWHDAHRRVHERNRIQREHLAARRRYSIVSVTALMARRPRQFSRRKSRAVNLASDSDEIAVRSASVARDAKAVKDAALPGCSDAEDRPRVPFTLAASPARRRAVELAVGISQIAIGPDTGVKIAERVDDGLAAGRCARTRSKGINDSRF
jgi:hypothetical protein